MAFGRTVRFPGDLIVHFVRRRVVGRSPTSCCSAPCCGSVSRPAHLLLWHGLPTVPPLRITIYQPSVANHDLPIDIPQKVGRSGDRPTTGGRETDAQQGVESLTHNVRAGCSEASEYNFLIPPTTIFPNDNSRSHLRKTPHDNLITRRPLFTDCHACRFAHFPTGPASRDSGTGRSICDPQNGRRSTGCWPHSSL